MKVLLIFLKINSFFTNNNLLKDTVDFTDDLSKTRRCWNNGKGTSWQKSFVVCEKCQNRKGVTYLISKRANNPLAVETGKEHHLHIFLTDHRTIMKHFSKKQVLYKMSQLYAVLPCRDTHLTCLVCSVLGWRSSSYSSLFLSILVSHQFI